MTNYNVNSRVEVYFSHIPEVNVRNRMKSLGWKWDANNRCWWGENTYINEVYVRDLCFLCNSDIFGYNVPKNFLHRSDKKNWEINSILNENGYSVSADYDSSDESRRNCLKNMITMRKATQNQLIYFLKGRIKISENNPQLKAHISKYEDDLEYVKSKKFTDVCINYGERIKYPPMINADKYICTEGEAVIKANAYIHNVLEIPKHCDDKEQYLNHCGYLYQVYMQGPENIPISDADLRHQVLLKLIADEYVTVDELIETMRKSSECYTDFYHDDILEYSIDIRFLLNGQNL